MKIHISKIVLRRFRVDRCGWTALVVAVCLLTTLIPRYGEANKPDKDSEPLSVKLSRLLGPRDAAVVIAPDGRVLAAIHDDLMLVPASILKVLTALAALHFLGAEHRYATEFYLNAQGDLTIKGYGDPLLVSERLETIAQQLATKVQTIRSLILDDSYFVYPIVIPGRSSSNEPYDAPNGALCVNFNTVNFKREKGKWVSAEPQTPLLPSIIPIIEASGLKSGRINLAADRKDSLRYTGELFSYFFKKAGIAIQGGIISGTVDKKVDQLLWCYHSPQILTEVIAGLMTYSNNFIANQLLLTMGAETAGEPATVEKGMQALRHYYHDVLGIKTGQLVEASGISRHNRISARNMMLILEKFAPYHQLMRHKDRQWYKTGTLKGIHTRVGYLEAVDGRFYRFVVMINTPGKTTDRVLGILEKELR